MCEPGGSARRLWTRSSTLRTRRTASSEGWTCEWCVTTHPSDLYKPFPARRKIRPFLRMRISIFQMKYQLNASKVANSLTASVFEEPVDASASLDFFGAGWTRCCVRPTSRVPEPSSRTPQSANTVALSGVRFGTRRRAPREIQLTQPCRRCVSRWDPSSSTREPDARTSRAPPRRRSGPPLAPRLFPTNASRREP